MFRVFNCLATEHDWRLVVLAGIVCFLASLAAVNLFHRSYALQGRSRAGWLLTASVATGAGIWATHFIAMLAFDPGIPVAFDIFSRLPPFSSQSRSHRLGLLSPCTGRGGGVPAAGGAVVGGGIACMHYTGIAAVQMSGEIIWAADLVVASIVLGIVLARGRAGGVATRGDSVAYKFTAAGVLTLAIVSHHFTAMGAAGLFPGQRTGHRPA